MLFLLPFIDNNIISKVIAPPVQNVNSATVFTGSGKTGGWIAV